MMLRSRQVKNPGSLFWTRVRSHWNHQRASLATVADWTVMLYIIVPGLLLGGGIYRELWTRPLPVWVDYIPVQGAASLLLLMFFGRVLLFLEEADVLFLRQHPHWIKGLMLRGMGYSICVSTVKGLLFTGLALPFLVRGYGFSGTALISLLLAAAACAWCANLAGRMIRSRYKGWTRRLAGYFSRWLFFGTFMLCVTFGLKTPLVLWLGAVIFLVLLPLLGRYRLRMKGTFMSDVREDASTRIQLTEKIMIQAVGKPPSIRSKTWLFRKSGRIFKGAAEKRLADAGFKAILRKSENLAVYLQITLLGIPAIWMPPHVVKVIVYIAMVILISYWLHTRWAQFAKAEFMHVLPFNNRHYRSAGVIVVRTLLILPAFLYSMVAGLTLFQGAVGWLAGLAFTVVAVLAAPSLTSWPVYKEERSLRVNGEEAGDESA